MSRHRPVDRHSARQFPIAVPLLDSGGFAMALAVTDDVDPRPARRDRRATLAEATAIVGGDAHRYFSRLRGPTPGWVHLNGFAHRDLDWVRLQTSWSFDRSVVPIGSERAVAWRWADAAIAGAITAAIGDDRALRELQHRHLVPLELALIARATDAPVMPCALVEAVEAALAHTTAGPPGR